MLLRTGIDLVSVSALTAHLAADSSLLDLVWTGEEQRDCADQLERLATRWAAKEATMKALGTAWPDVAWEDITVRSGPSGPILVLSGEAAAVSERLGLTYWDVSLSHESINEDTLATAVVVAIGSEVSAVPTLRQAP